MGYLAGYESETLPVPGRDGKPDPSGATVTFRGDAAFDDELELARATQHLNEVADDVERVHGFRVARALLMIESWTLADGDGQVLPLTADVLRTKLSRRVAAWIDEQSTRRYEGREEEDEGPFDTRSPQPSMATT
jgi:hypothetical protein